MPFFVVTSEKALSEVATAVLKARTSATNREAALRSIRLANPGVDFDRLPPGAVLRIPQLEGVRAGVSKDDPLAVELDDLLGRVRGGIDELQAAADSAETQRAVEKREAQELLSSAVVKRLSAQIPQLQANIDTIRETFKQDDVTARNHSVELAKATEVWTADLETLRGLLDT